MFHVLSFQKYFNRVCLNSVFLAVPLATLISFSFASNISNYVEWRNLSPAIKTTYTAGAIDSFINPLTPNNEHARFVKQFNSCLTTLHITMFEVAQMVDNFYLNPDNWSRTPQEAIRFQLMNGHCFHFFD